MSILYDKLFKKLVVKKHCEIYNNLFPKDKIITNNEKELTKKIHDNFNKNKKINMNDKNLLRFNLNTIFKLDLSNYLVILVTLFITIFSAYYVHILSMEFEIAMSKFNEVNTISEKLGTQKDLTTEVNSKLLEQKNIAIKETEEAFKKYGENIAPNNALFQIMWLIIAIISIACLYKMYCIWCNMCKESLYKLCLDTIEDIQKEYEKEVEKEEPKEIKESEKIDDSEIITAKQKIQEYIKKNRK